ncbi:MAG: hypothetical protein IPP29_01305 [Bacteroidetes bacterium]|nr:hypothetical protein [Bacteroidota bacterium]
MGDDGPRCGGVINAITNNGTSFLWNNGAATQSIVATQPGQYNITVTNSAGCIAHDTVSISIVTPPVFNLGNDTASCGPIEIKGPVGMQNYFWNVDDWLTQTDTSSFYFYGIGQVSLTVIDSNGCIARDSLNISAYQPIVDFDSTKKGCNYVNLQSNNFYNATYLWSDGSTLSYLNADTSGLYTCTATAAGCISTDSCYVTVFYLQNFNLGKDTILCHQNSYTLNCSIPNMKYNGINTTRFCPILLHPLM